MSEIKKVAVLIKRKQDLFEGLRTSLGLAVENLYTHMFVLDVEVNLTDEYQENLEWLDELECQYYSNNKSNISYGFIYLNYEEIVKKLETMDLVIPF